MNQPPEPGATAVVSTFPPAVCGIGIYAEQQVARMQEARLPVTRLDLAPLQQFGWKPGARGHLRPFLRTAKRSPRIVLHYQAWMFRDDTIKNRILRRLWPQLVLIWFLLRNGRRTEMVVHEYGYDLGRWPFKMFQYVLAAATLALPRSLVFHTEWELAQYKRRFPRRRRISIKAHESDFRLHASADRAAARKALGIPAEERTFLCIGFYKAHKGFRALAARFAALREAGRVPAPARLRIVTSVQDAADHESVADLAALRTEAAAGASVVLHEGYVSDEAFDQWLAAADVVALPYTRIFSSGVAARARLMGRTILASSAGGLPEQAGPEGVVYRSDEELEDALVRLARAAS